MLPLTDVTTTTGKTAVLNTISSMWPRDAGGTQVHIGMIWGWRVLSPNGPFTANNGHPLSYSTASTTGWKKAVVLMTDGEEEWPATDNMTGLGQIADGKIDTTSDTTAVTNLGTRLASVCSNMAAGGNFVIYTIGLGNGGSSNTAAAKLRDDIEWGFLRGRYPDQSPESVQRHRQITDRPPAQRIAASRLSKLVPPGRPRRFVLNPRSRRRGSG